MAKSELFSSLPDVIFAEKDPSVIEREVISRYEEASGRTLALGDPVRIFLDSVILALIQQRNLIDHAAKMNLLAYASGEYLDHIGAMLGVSRLEASHASVSIQFSLSSALNYPVIIPAGTRVTPDGKILFATNLTVTINTGEIQKTVSATCTEAGIIGNGFLPGQINKVVDVFPYELKAENISESYGGTDIENDENFRERIQIAPESFTTAGSIEAYKYYARSAHPDIIDVSVITPPLVEPGHVNIIPLMAGGEIPSDEIIESVYASCNAEDVRPDTDYVTVLKPEEIKYNLSVYYWIDAKDSLASYAVMQRVESAIADWVKWQRLSLGRDINPSELSRRIMNAGAKRCEIQSPCFTVLYKNQIAVLGNRNVYYAGIEES